MTAVAERPKSLSVRAMMQPLPKQEQALEAIYSHLYVLYGGAAGPGKSYWLRWGALHFLIEAAGAGIRGVRVGLFSEDYPTLRDRQISRIKREFPPWLGHIAQTQDEGLAFFLRPEWGGGMIALRNLDDPAKYASTEFAAVFVDELTKNPRQTFDDLRFRLRWPGLSHFPFVAASNPGSRGHGWVKKLFVDHDFSGDDVDLNPEDFAFIPALPRDNPYLPESYWRQLDTLPDHMRRALRDGDWSVFVGQAFTEWRTQYHVCEPIAIPDDWTRWTATDYGYAAPYCTLWFARPPDKSRVYVYREHYKAGVEAAEQARRLKAASDGEQHAVRVADPSMWQTRENDKGGTNLAAEYFREGVMIGKANNNRIAGKNTVHEALRWEADSTGTLTRRPRLQVFRTCGNLVRTLPDLPLDDLNPEDVDTDAEDHAYDALRYGLSVERKPPAVIGQQEMQAESATPRATYEDKPELVQRLRARYDEQTRRNDTRMPRVR